MASLPTEVLEYKPLIGTEIRLLSIKPNNGAGPLECRLAHYGFEPDKGDATEESHVPTPEQPFPPEYKPRYHALSYVWGDSTEKVPIIVNGRRLDIGKSLHAALFRIQKIFRSGNYQRIGPRYLDLANSSRLIWADAICINQADIDEKSRQVPRMGDIYREAADVIAWLGSPDEKDLPALERWVRAVPIFFELEDIKLDSANVFQRLQFLCAISQSEKSESLAKIVPVLGHVLPPAIYEAYLNGTLEEVLIEGDAQECCKALHEGIAKFMSNEWFSRIWTVQEALLARGGGLCNFLIGDLRTSFTAVVAVKVFMDALSDRMQNTIFSTYPSFMSLTNLYGWFDVDNYRSETDHTAVAHRLNDVIRLTKHRKAKSPHDHIYGLLGLLDASKLPQHLKPNYSRPFEQVWHEYMVFVVEETGDLNRLCCSGRTLDGVPDWVPDLRLTGKTLKTPLEESFVSFSADRQKLYAQGIRLGNIVGVFVIETDRTWDFEDSRYWSAETTTSYEACSKQLEDFGEAILSRAKELRGCTDEEIFGSVAYGSWYSEWDIRDRYSTLGDLLEPRLSADGNESEEEQQRRTDCIALAKRLSDGPTLLVDTGLLVQDRHDGERGFAYEDGPGGKLTPGTEILCMLKGSNWPWRLRKAGDEYELIGDSCIIIEEGERPTYDTEYYENKEIEKFVIM